MRISAKTVSVLGTLVTGNPGGEDTPPMAYRSGPELVEFFNQFGGNDTYGQNFPSRWRYAEEKIKAANGTPALPKIIAAVLDPREFIDAPVSAETVAEYLNQYLEYDGYKAVRVGKAYRVQNISGSAVELASPYEHSAELTHVFIEEQIGKIDRRIADADFGGAITNARSLVEAVLVAVEKETADHSEPCKGNLLKLYKRVQKLLNLDPARKDISDSLRQILSGLTSIVAGLAPLRNKMSDAHPITYRPSRHHAKLAANAAKTLADFLFETLEYQRAHGLIDSTPKEKG